MTPEDFEILQTVDSQSLTEEMLISGLDPIQVAIRVKNPAIATQIKYLHKATKKLPSYFSARCIISEQGFEQCSSEHTARAKFDGMQGSVAIDLTCGLGVDSYELSKHFDSVISVEMDPLRYAIAKHNFTKLGAKNITLHNDSAENFLANNPSIKVDLVYVDPSRKTGGERRVFSLEESSPNILKIIDLLQNISNNIIIKLSPMFDIDECFRVFGGNIDAQVVSMNGECKEVLVRMGAGCSGKIINTILRGNKFNQYKFANQDSKAVDPNSEFTPQYLFVPDVSFIKSRTLKIYLHDFYSHFNINYDGYVISDTKLDNFAGQCFKINRTETYQPKKIKKILKELNITHATISHLKFPYSTAKIVTDLGIKEGGSERLFFSTYRNKATIFFVTLP